MKNYPAKAGFIKYAAMIPCLLLFTNFLQAQNNASYNVNSIPIGGTFNTAFGWQALFSTTGTYNTANGYQALYLNTTGSYNTATGYYALYTNTTGGGNTGNGVYALFLNTTGSNNAASGANALYSNTIGNGNTANGNQSLYSNTSGSYNTANGLSALYSNTTGFYNTANGFQALYSNTTGTNNTAIGDSAGYISTGSGNIFIGHRAGANETGNNKLYIGSNATQTLLYGDISTGQVLLGKPDATGYVFKGTRTLNVLGGIIADSVRVALSGLWADHVFNKSYPLQALSEVEEYIAANKHLPGIPTAADVKNEGINVADMESKLLEKIEELTLYIIAQQKEINELKKNKLARK